MIDNYTATKVLKGFVPISRFNKGECGKIIEEVKADGIRVIVKNNSPECVLISVQEYDRLVELANRQITVCQDKDWDSKRMAFINKIRERVAPPIPAKISLEQAVRDYGPIDVDEDAVNELRRLG